MRPRLLPCRRATPRLVQAPTRTPAEQIGPQLAYFYRLVKRLDAVGMDPRTELYRSARLAFDAVHGLRITTMYLALDEHAPKAGWWQHRQRLAESRLEGDRTTFYRPLFEVS